MSRKVAVVRRSLQEIVNDSLSLLDEMCTAIVTKHTEAIRQSKKGHLPSLFSVTGQIARLTKDLENSEKKLRETRNSMSQQSGKKEAEYQQIITNLNRTTTENITKLKEEKVCETHDIYIITL